MLIFKELKPNVYELTLQGVLEKSDIETMERDLAPALKGDQPIGLIVRAEGWKDITADAMAEDIKFEFSHLTQWAKIAKMAMVTDLQAFSALLKWIDPILPMIDMKCFFSSEVAAAETFASDLPAVADVSGGTGIKLLADGSNGVVAFEIDGRITGDDAEKLFDRLEGAMDSDSKINVLVRFTHWDGFDPALLLNGSTMASKLGMVGHLKRYAVVGAPGWMKGVVTAMGPAMPFDMAFFDLDNEDSARKWIGMS